MTFDFDKFIKEISKDYENDFSFEEIKSLLSLNESYSKDNPISTGKKILLDYIHFKGVKETPDTQIYTNSQIDYKQKFSSGINIIIADNLKGKSSVFKLIKYALTGSNSLKPNVKKWIKKLILCLTIGSKKYTICLIFENRLKSALYYGHIFNFSDIENNKENIIFTSNNETDYQNQIEDFFFNQFSYYSLKWTQKNPAKDSNELLEASTSWKTYFKSIFLESKDSASLIYGGQDRKIFQMLLGLQLTYPINKLSVKKDFLQNKKSKNELLLNKTTNSSNMQSLKQELDELNSKINKIDSSYTENDISLYNEHDSIIQKIMIENNNKIELEAKYNNTSDLLYMNVNRKKELEKDLNNLKLEILKNTKRLNDLQEYQDIGVFFSNLDIKHCPNCNHDVSIDRVNNSRSDSKCSLCNEEITTKSNENNDLFKSKMEELKELNNKMELEITAIKKQIDEFELLCNNQESEVRNIENERNKPDKIEILKKELSSVKEKIKESIPSKNNRDALLQRKAIVEYQITENDTPNTKNIMNYDKQIALVEDAVSRLNLIRFESGKEILSRLSEIMLSEIHEFGLTSISEIQVTEKFDLLYRQDGDFITFNDIAEGEQLRAKLAFYLSLIQLDIEKNFSRHTRFLIIDSPGKEEADAKYLNGLSNVLKSIQTRYGSELQILIGTAERQLSNIVENEYITPVDGFIF